MSTDKQSSKPVEEALQSIERDIATLRSELTGPDNEIGNNVRQLAVAKLQELERRLQFMRRD